MNMRKTLPLTCPLCLLAFSSTVLGQDERSTTPEDTGYELASLTVTTATRSDKQIGSIPQTVSVVFEDTLNDQMAISSDLVGAISQLAPSYSPSRQKMSGAGETFRGRSPLFMIDGVPQSNPLRDGSRDGYTIDPAMIERIELVHGASAAQGMGATGGIINYVTKKAPEFDGTQQWMQVGLSTGNEFDSEGIGTRAAYRIGHRSGDLGVVGAVSYEWRPMAYDGEGNLIGVDTAQGDTMNSRTIDLYGKISYRLAPDQEVVVAVNRFKMEQDLEYIVPPPIPDAHTHAEGVPTISVKGETPGKAPTNDVVTASVSYRHNAVFDGKLSLDLFLQDFAATYGGGTFDTFVLDGVNIFDQSENQSEKHGAKLTYVRDLDELFDLGLVTGIDYLSDETQQVLVQTGRQWVPETTYESWAPYVQLDRPFGPFSVTAGARYESAELQVNDFQTLESYGSQLVSGGSPSFNELLFNVGATYRVTSTTTLFASYAQGFGMPDVGRVLRGINVPDQNIDTFLNLEPIVTDNYEVGTRWQNRDVRGSISAFWSSSDFGSRLKADADGFYSVLREKTEIWGLEADLEYDLSEADTIGAVFAWLEGESDTNDDGEIDTRLDGANIPPARVNLHWMRQWTPDLRSRLQTSTYFDRDHPATGDDGTFDFDGYTLVDVLVAYRLPRGTITASVENLFDKQYITYYSQTVGNDLRNFAGRGRTLTVRYSLDF